VGSTSPYLLQHAHNPVDWYPWGADAIERAKSEDRPLFLSIGYAACHWCHVMERESFESEAVAELLNREFVCIKVDREERPDLDEIYMTATQLMTHSGGWPMSVFLTTDLKPFYAGTYFPPEDRWGRPGFRTLLTEIARAWRERRTALEEQADRVTDAIRQVTGGVEGQGTVGENLIRRAVEEMARTFDRTDGGFGGAPKFPPSMRIELLLRWAARERDAAALSMATHTLDRMAQGGMYDQVGGGFHRYSVDERWLVPHFEKMLYDNALLARVYLLAYEQTNRWYYRRVAREILDYVLREMTSPEGGFYSATDADSEGEEGRFFVWSPAAVAEVLGDEAARKFCRVYDVTPRGNFEGHSIPNLLHRGLPELARDAGIAEEELDRELAPLRRKLWEAREARVHPLLDDKVLMGWNGLMIRAFVEGFRVLQEPRYRDAASRALRFLLTQMRGNDGRLLRASRSGVSHLNAYQEDYAAVILALFDLHATTGDAEWKDEGIALLEQMNAAFWDELGSSYFFTRHDHEALIARARSPQDNATPSGNSMAARALIRAARVTGNVAYRAQAARLLMAFAPQMANMPAGFPNMLVAADEFLAEWPEGVTIPGADSVELEAFLSRSVVQPGGRFWAAVRIRVADGTHINSARPRQPHLQPTQLLVGPEGSFTVVRESFPAGTSYQAPYESDALSVYSGTVLLGVEIEAPRDLRPGAQELHLAVRMQPCDDQQCYPALEAKLRVTFHVGVKPGQEQHPEVFEPIRARSRSEG
jgi:uncharacterized protein YyaL (SSP411 family)